MDLNFQYTCARTEYFFFTIWFACTIFASRYYLCVPVLPLRPSTTFASRYYLVPWIPVQRPFFTCPLYLRQGFAFSTICTDTPLHFEMCCTTFQQRTKRLFPLPSCSPGLLVPSAGGHTHTHTHIVPADTYTHTHTLCLQIHTHFLAPVCATLLPPSLPPSLSFYLAFYPASPPHLLPSTQSLSSSSPPSPPTKKNTPSSPSSSPLSFSLLSFLSRLSFHHVGHTAARVPAQGARVAAACAGEAGAQARAAVCAAPRRYQGRAPSLSRRPLRNSGSFVAVCGGLHCNAGSGGGSEKDGASRQRGHRAPDRGR